ncbi:MAG: hypothetical protein PHD97_06220 [Bacteroidales bacterium]|nr:hypothetical protein [Bacteroidales bacterium]
MPITLFSLKLLHSTKSPASHAQNIPIATGIAEYVSDISDILYDIPDILYEISYKAYSFKLAFQNQHK